MALAHLHAQPHQTQRGAVVEHDDEDDAIADDGEVQAFLGAFVEDAVELLLTEELGVTAAPSANSSSTTGVAEPLAYMEST